MDPVIRNLKNAVDTAERTLNGRQAEIEKHASEVCRLREVFDALADLCPADATASWWEIGVIRDKYHARQIAEQIAKSFGVEVKA